LTPKGKLLGIVRVVRAGDEELLLDTDRVSLQDLFDRIRRASVGHQAELEKATLETAQLSLIGPKAEAVAGTSDLGEPHMVRDALLGGARVRMVSTDMGVDLLLPAAAREGVITALYAAGASDGDEAAAQFLRVQAGDPLYGVDLDDSVIPQEANLNHRLVSFTKGCYVGQETVARLFYRGSPNRALRGLLLDDAPETGTPLTLNGKEVGRLGSVVAPEADAVTGLAIVRLEAQPGTLLDAGGIEAEVVELPFHVLDSPSGAA
jgi:folate-binding protein YgfZ